MQLLTLVNLITDVDKDANAYAYSDYNAGGYSISSPWLRKSALKMCFFLWRNILHCSAVITRVPGAINSNRVISDTAL